MRTIRLGNKNITEGCLPYIIAEIGVNHEGSLKSAIRLIELAKEGGANAAKFQTYKAETLASKHSPAYWDTTKEATKSQYELFKKFDSFGKKEYIVLSEHCRKIGIDFLSTPFDEQAVDFLDPLVPFFKIASADITNIPLLRRVAQCGKPVVLSTGASRMGEVEEAVNTLSKSGCKDIALLHCVLNYPTNLENAHIAMIDSLKKVFPNLIIGYSDHTLPDQQMLAVTAAYVSGALIIEKHFTHDKSLPGNDHYHAMDCEDLTKLKQNLHTVQSFMGDPIKFPIPTEAISRKNARRSIVAKKHIQAGELLTTENITCKRPAFGISPIYWDRVVGTRATENIVPDQCIHWKDVEHQSWPEKVVAIIGAELVSDRLVMASLAGTPLIRWIFERTRMSKLIHEIVLVTSSNSANDVIARAANLSGITVVRGEHNDPLSHFVLGATKTKADIAVCLFENNPFIEPSELDRLVTQFRSSRPDYAFNHMHSVNGEIVHGFGAEILSTRLLNDLSKSLMSTDDRRHFTAHIRNNPHAFDIEELAVFKAAEQSIHIESNEDLERLQLFARKMGIHGSTSQVVSNH